MSTKAVLQASIATIDNGGNNTASEVRQVFTDALNNAYGSVVVERYNNLVDNTPNTIPNGITHHYDVTMLKQGREVTVSGVFTNKSGGIISNEAIFSVGVGEYFQDLNDVGFYGFQESNGTPVRCIMDGSSLMVSGAIGNNVSVRVNFKYYTQD